MDRKTMDKKHSVFKFSKLLPVFILSILMLQGCAGTKTYTNNVLAGETAVFGAGYKQYFII